MRFSTVKNRIERHRIRLYSSRDGEFSVMHRNNPDVIKSTLCGVNEGFP